MGLAEYKKKRDFKVTAEPSGKPLPKLVKGACRFVIQKHDASRLHYDFRLEMDGVLKSWAVPKGLPWEKGEKHLAVEVEDHPVEYATFEGIIPQGQYGGGTVMVWDRGQYHVYGEDPLKALRDGRLQKSVSGKDLNGWMRPLDRLTFSAGPRDIAALSRLRSLPGVQDLMFGRHGESLEFEILCEAGDKVVREIFIAANAAGARIKSFEPHATPGAVLSQAVPQSGVRHG
jgi:DNA ligase D-like protein (predicted 3'-phosphoesterase)